MISRIPREYLKLMVLTQYFNPGSVIIYCTCDICKPIGSIMSRLSDYIFKHRLCSSALEHARALILSKYIRNP